MSDQPIWTFPNVLPIDRYLTIEDLIERSVTALRSTRPFALVRWGDGENRIMEEGQQARDNWQAFQHYGNHLTMTYYDLFRQAYLQGVAVADVLGMFPGDWWTCRVLHEQNISIQHAQLVYAWCNRHWNARREWADEVLGKPWRTILVGNRMAEYKKWLAARFPALCVEWFGPMRDWPDATTACDEIHARQPELVLASVGWYAPIIVHAAKAAGAVGIDYGHCPDYHMSDAMLPNTCCPRGPDGCAEHYKHGNFADCIPQEREIKL